MKVEICGALACLGGKRDALRKRGQVFTGGDSQRRDRGSPAAPGVSARQAGAAPQIVATRGRKIVDGIRDCRDVGAFHEPDTAAEALVEHASFVAVEMRGNCAPLDVSRPTEIAFVKTVTVDHEPTEQRIESR